jgi:hypothetical protein
MLQAIFEVNRFEKYCPPTNPTVPIPSPHGILFWLRGSLWDRAGISLEIVLIKTRKMRENISVSVCFLKFTGNYPYKQELLSY